MTRYPNGFDDDTTIPTVTPYIQPGPTGATGPTGPAGDSTAAKTVANYVALKALSVSGDDIVDGQLYTVQSDPTRGPWIWNSSSGANVASDEKTVVKLDETVISFNSRFYNTQGAAILPTIASLRAATAGIHDRITVQGFAVAGDNGGSSSFVKITGSTVDDGGITIVPTGVTTFYYKRQFSGPVDVKWFGAKADCITITDAVTLASSNILTSALTTFTSADIGKIVLLNTPNTPGAGTITPSTSYVALHGYLVTMTSAHSLVANQAISFGGAQYNVSEIVDSTHIYVWPAPPNNTAGQTYYTRVNLATSIIAFNNFHSVTLADAATVSGTGRYACYGSDNKAAFDQAISAGVTLRQKIDIPGSTFSYAFSSGLATFTAIYAGIELIGHGAALSPNPLGSPTHFVSDYSPGTILRFFSGNGITVDSVSGHFSGLTIRDTTLIGSASPISYGFSRDMSMLRSTSRINFSNVAFGNWQFAIDLNNNYGFTSTYLNIAGNGVGVRAYESNTFKCDNINANVNGVGFHALACEGYTFGSGVFQGHVGVASVYLNPQDSGHPVSKVVFRNIYFENNASGVAMGSMLKIHTATSGTSLTRWSFDNCHSGDVYTLDPTGSGTVEFPITRNNTFAGTCKPKWTNWESGASWASIDLSSMSSTNMTGISSGGIIPAGVLQFAPVCPITSGHAIPDLQLSFLQRIFVDDNVIVNKPTFGGVDPPLSWTITFLIQNRANGKIVTWNAAFQNNPWTETGVAIAKWSTITWMHVGAGAWICTSYQQFDNIISSSTRTVSSYTTMRALTILTDGLTAGVAYTVQSDPTRGPWVYTLDGAGDTTDDALTVVRTTETSSGSNGRFRNSQGAAILPTIAALRAAKSGIHERVTVQGYATPGDNGGSSSFVKITGSAIDDGGITIVPTGVTAFYYKRQFSGPIDIRWFGGIMNDSSSPVKSSNVSAFNAAIASLPSTGGEIKFPDGIFYVNSELVITSRSGIKISGSNRYSSTIKADVTVVTYSAGNGQTTGAVLKFLTCEDCTVSDIRIEGTVGTLATRPSGIESRRHSLLHNCSRLTVRNTTIGSDSGLANLHGIRYTCTSADTDGNNENGIADNVFASNLIGAAISIEHCNALGYSWYGGQLGICSNFIRLRGGSINVHGAALTAGAHIYNIGDGYPSALVDIGTPTFNGDSYSGGPSYPAFYDHASSINGCLIEGVDALIYSDTFPKAEFIFHGGGVQGCGVDGYYVIDWKSTQGTGLERPQLIFDSFTLICGGANVPVRVTDINSVFIIKHCSGIGFTSIAWGGKFVHHDNRWLPGSPTFLPTNGAVEFYQGEKGGGFVETDVKNRTRSGGVWVDTPFSNINVTEYIEAGHGTRPSSGVLRLAGGSSAANDITYRNALTPFGTWKAISAPNDQQLDIGEENVALTSLNIRVHGTASIVCNGSQAFACNNTGTYFTLPCIKQNDGAGVTFPIGFWTINNTPATLNNQQAPAYILQNGNGWATDGYSRAVSSYWQTLPIQGTNLPSVRVKFGTNINNVGNIDKFAFDSNGNIITNPSGSSIATNATNGFTYLPTCAGIPTGTPTSFTGAAPMVIDSTNNKLYFYSGGAWRLITST